MKIQSAAPFNEPKFILRYTNDIGEQTYLVATGEVYRGQRLISHVSQKRKYARRYETAKEALEVLVQAKAVINNDEGTFKGWDVLPVKE